MTVEIIYSCWKACVEPDPEDPENKLEKYNLILTFVSFAYLWYF
jgi:hypothetical protein